MLRWLSLAVVCALLPWSWCTEQTMEQQQNKCMETLQFQEKKFLKMLEHLDLDACKKLCCEDEEWKDRCDTVVHADHQCSLFHCGDKCTFQDNNNCSHTVFMKPGPRSNDGNLLEALMLSPVKAGEEKEREEEKKEKEEEENHREEQKNNSVCVLPPVVGLCKAAFRRFHYDPESKSCKQFIYGGCGGNGNNFEDKEECERTCPGETRVVEKVEAPSEIQTLRSVSLKQTEMTKEDFQEQCKAPRVIGPCRAAHRRWFYNSTAGQCQLFIYGGCRGNKNNYDTEEHCTSNCAAVKLLPSKKLSEEDTAHCALAPESGPCRAAFTMYFFDMDTQTCKTFLYGGCKGNDNRYTSEAECQERCSNLNAEGRGQGRNRWTAAFFLFLTLAAVSFLLLTALIVITMRRNRQLPRRPLSIRSDKEELLPDSDSLDSLPLPESPTKA